MLTVRPESIEAVQQDRLAEANRRLVDYAQKRFPSVFKAQHAQRSLKLVEQIRGKAAGFGITREDNVATMLDLATMYGLDFDKVAWAADALSNPKLHGPDKISILKRRLRKQEIKI